MKKKKDLLRSCVLEFGGNWEDLLPLVEFTYNNSHQSTIGMALYEALYGRKCQYPNLLGGSTRKEAFGT